MKVAVGDTLYFFKSPHALMQDCIFFAHAGYIPDDPKYGGTFTVPAGVTLHFYTLHGQSNLSSPKDVFNRPDDAQISFVAPRVQTKQVVFFNEKKQEKDVRYDRVVDKATGNFVIKNEYIGMPRKALQLLTDAKEFSLPAAAEKKKQGGAQAAAAAGGQPKPDRWVRAAGLERKVFKPGETCYNYLMMKALGEHWKDKNPKTDKPWSYEDIEEIQKQNSQANGKWAPHFVSIRNRKAFWNSNWMLLSDAIQQILAAMKTQNRTITDFWFAGCRGIHPGWKPSQGS